MANAEITGIELVEFWGVEPYFSLNQGDLGIFDFNQIYYGRIFCQSTKKHRKLIQSK
jgi:hypothetical protein